MKTWLITGASRGFGRAFAEAALERGDRVAVTARTLADLDPLLDRYGDAVVPLQLDVTDTEADASAVQTAAERLGRIDIVVNNAGRGLFGAVEELSADTLRETFEVNFFGAVAVTRAVLPVLRAQRSGHIVQVSSMAGVTTAPLLGGYSATKWALEALTESLASEVKSFGIAVTLVEPGAYGTDFNGNVARTEQTIGAYDPVRQAMFGGGSGGKPGDPAAAAQALLTVVDSPNPPLRVIFGDSGTDRAVQAAQARINEWQQTRETALAAQG